MSKYILAISTCKSEDAEHIAKRLVEARICACVNIIETVRSIYHWKGQIEDEKESLILIKTEVHLEAALKETLLDIHPYETPEFITIEVRSGSEAYLDWISSSIAQ